MARQTILLTAIFAAGIAASYGLAVLGEPQSEWVWCEILGACRNR